MPSGCLQECFQIAIVISRNTDGFQPRCKKGDGRMFKHPLTPLDGSALVKCTTARRGSTRLGDLDPGLIWCLAHT